MEKQGIIRPGVTPPEPVPPGVKRATTLEDHTSRRLTDQALEQLSRRPLPTSSQASE